MHRVADCLSKFRAEIPVTETSFNMDSHHNVVILKVSALHCRQVSLDVTGLQSSAFLVPVTWSSLGV